MRFVLALAIGFALGCRLDPIGCDAPLGCDHCRNCAVDDPASCQDSWRACTFDPNCDAILACVDECPWEGFADCERDCRGTFLGGAVMYEDLVGCLDDACALDCA
jgi:hypothetical protein